MRRYRIKIVPTDDLNAEGEWLEVEHEDISHVRSWIEQAGALWAHVPLGHTIVAIRSHLVDSNYFDQLREANKRVAEMHERAIACGAEWDGQDGYRCPRTDGTCECFSLERAKP
jgi:hypothetical protein